MDADQREILLYLKSWQNQFVSAREICRRAAGKRRYREDPRWALPVLNRMIEEGLIESDAQGHYRIKQQEKVRKPRRWIAPHIARILRESGKEFDGVSPIDLKDPEET